MVTHQPKRQSGLSLRPELWDRLDAYAAKNNASRNAVIERALERAYGDHPTPDKPVLWVDSACEVDWEAVKAALHEGRDVLLADADGPFARLETPRYRKLRQGGGETGIEIAPDFDDLPADILAAFTS